jgi:hypothetical protein
MNFLAKIKVKICMRDRVLFSWSEFVYVLIGTSSIVDYIGSIYIEGVFG